MLPGKPTGILIDKAQGLVASKIPARTRVANRSMQSCALPRNACGPDSQEFTTRGLGRRKSRRISSSSSQGRLPIRIYAMIGGAGPLWKHYLANGPEVGERLTVRSIKLMADGAMGSRGAAFFEPYADDPKNTGLLMLTKDRIEKIARASRQAWISGEHARDRRSGESNSARRLRRSTARQER